MVDGKKTYIIGTLSILFGLSGYLIGQFDLAKAGAFVMAGATALGFRSAFKKIEGYLKDLRS